MSPAACVFLSLLAFLSQRKLFNIHEMLNKRYGRTAKPAVEATDARLASVSIVEWVIFLRTKRKECRLGKI